MYVFEPILLPQPKLRKYIHNFNARGVPRLTGRSKNIAAFIATLGLTKPSGDVKVRFIIN